MPKAKKESFFARIHAHPRARLLEFLVWGVPGALVVALAFLGMNQDWLSDAIGGILVVVGVSLVGWGLIPPVKQKAKAPPPGRRRRELAERRGR